MEKYFYSSTHPPATKCITVSLCDITRRFSAYFLVHLCDALHRFGPLHRFRNDSVAAVVHMARTVPDSTRHCVHYSVRGANVISLTSPQQTPLRTPCTFDISEIKLLFLWFRPHSAGPSMPHSRARDVVLFTTVSLSNLNFAHPTRGTDFYRAIRVICSVRVQK